MFSDVTFSSQGKRKQALCTACTNIKEVLQMKLSKEDLNNILEKRAKHLDLQSLCRAKYYKHIKKAKDNPEEYLSVIIDNMDQAKTRLPSFAMCSKADAQLSKIQHHVTGIKAHGADKNFIFTWTDGLAGDANITLNSLVYVIHSLSQEFGRCPPVLYLQADNSGKDNKNSFVSMFLAWLVKNNIFRKVKLSFLMVGHTHEDVDQMFSRISVHQHHVSSTTLPVLHKNIEDSLTPMPAVKHFTGLIDYKDSFSQCRGIIEGISGPHQFVVKKVNEMVILKYKDRPRPSDTENVLDLTDSIPAILCPKPVSLNMKILSEVDKMKLDLGKWKVAGRLSVEEVEWWASYLDQLTSISVNVPSVLDLSSYSVVLTTCEKLPANLQVAIDQAIEKQDKHTVLKLKKKRN